MDRDTIKNLLMTTSVVAIIAGTSHEAAAILPTCPNGVSGGSTASYTQSTSVNCVLINDEIITGDVTVAHGVTVGPTTLVEFEILDSTVGGGFFNHGTVIGNIGSAGGSGILNIGLEVDGDTTIGNGVTNAADGVFSINIAETATTGGASARGIGIDITSSSFAGNLVNNGLIDVEVLADPPGTAIADATGMGVQSSSFVGNVLNTSPLTVIATAIAGADLGTVGNAFATARAKGIVISGGMFSGTSINTGGAPTSISFSDIFQGNITNNGVINAAATAIASAGGVAGGLGAAATAIADGILVGGQTFVGNVTNSGSGAVAVTLTDRFTGSITNNSTIFSSATAFAVQGNTTNPVQATSFAQAFGIHVLGNQIVGSATAIGSTEFAVISSTVSADFALNVANHGVIVVDSFAEGVANLSNTTALATVHGGAFGIDIVGVDAKGNLSLTGNGSITNLYNGSFNGNISNSGLIEVDGFATGTAATTGGTQLATAVVTQTADGIRFAGLDFTGNISDPTGIVSATSHITFFGNVSNSGLIEVDGTAQGTAVATTGTALTTVDSNAAGISLIGASFRGNVTGDANVFSRLTFFGNITNTSSGSIRVFGSAFGDSTVAGGTGIADVHASAAGIRIIGQVANGNTNNDAFFNNDANINGNVINNGQIFATALAGGIVGGEGSAAGLTLAVSAVANGIEILGDEINGEQFFEGSFSGNLTNTGTIVAWADASGTIASTGINHFATVEASANGILMVLSSIGGNVTNTGSINARASASLASTLGASTALAFAQGVDVAAGGLFGNVSNTGGVIRAYATAFNSDTTGTAIAGAIGMEIFADHFEGNVSNTGSIFAGANATETALSGAAFASVEAISVTGGEFFGRITNAAGGLLYANAIAVADTFAAAGATGIHVAMDTVSGAIVNNGSIMVIAQASEIAIDVDGSAIASAAGIHIGDPNGDTVSVAFADVTNTGSMTVLATAFAQPFALANAGGIVIGNATSQGSLFGLTTFSGNVSNTGTISVQATANSANGAVALAAGILGAATQFTGNVSNSGNITAIAVANLLSVGPVIDFPFAGANAAGIAVLGETSAINSDGMTSFAGNVTNSASGTITAQAFASVGTNFSEAQAHAAGIVIAGGIADGFVFFGTSNFSGNVGNQGVIASTASAGNIGEQAYAASFGVEVLASTFNGGVTNGGTIMSNATAAASSPIFGLEIDGVSAIAHADGILLAGAETFANGVETPLPLGKAFFSSFMFGDIANTGVISANANASIVNTNPEVVSTVGAFATGINVSALIAEGNITNSSTGFIQASASVSATGTLTAFGSVLARGIAVDAVEYEGNVSNAGTILAMATSTVGGNASIAFGAVPAVASGISINTIDGFFGNVMNSGFIAASASSSNISAFGSALARDEAFGIAINGSRAVGTITNSGTLVHVSSFVGNIKNAGTIMAFSNANAVIGTNLGDPDSFAVAFDPATGILVAVGSFSGGIGNQGLIIAGSTATASGPTENLAAVAIAAGIGINTPQSTIFDADETILTGNVFAPAAFFPNSVFVGNISNSGSIMVNANASLSGGSGTLLAAATGIRVFASTVIGNVSNSGFIQANATATAQINIFGSIGGEAVATGIHIGGVQAIAESPTPIFWPINPFTWISSFSGNVTNTGTIMAFATATNVPLAFAAGIEINVSTFTGNVGNLGKGVISAMAQVSGPTFATAEAAGIDVSGSTFVGGISNEGTILVLATTGAAIPSALVEAAGIELDVTTFIGDITNSGQIMVSATAVTQPGTAVAEAVGIGAFSDNFLGNISNTGTITAFATAASNEGLSFPGQLVQAFGIYTEGETFVGDISNTAPGVIVAIASAPAFFSQGTAIGITVNNGTFIGNVSNTGTVMATGIGGGVAAVGVGIYADTFTGNVNNDGAGLILAKSSTFAVGIDIGALSFVGNINNNALIIASGDATGIYSHPGSTFVGAINNTGTIIGTGGQFDIGIRVAGPSITEGINNSGTVQGGFASIDMWEETGPGTTINNTSKGLLMGDVLLSATADTLNVYGGSTVMGNITGNVTNNPGSGPHGIGNSDIVNFDLTLDGTGGTLSPSKAFSLYRYKISDVDTVNLLSGTLILGDEEVMGTVTLGPGNIDPVGVVNQSDGMTLGLQVNAGHITTLGPTTPPTVQTLTITSGVGFVSANTVNISTGAVFKAFEVPDYYANTNIYPNVVVGLTSMNGNYAEFLVLSNSPLLAAFMIENGGNGGPGQDTLVLTRQAFNRPLGQGLTPNENAAGLGLESLYGTGNSTAMAILPPLFGLNGPEYAAALKSLDGETILERPDLWQTVLDSILHRLSQGEGFNGQGVAGAMLNHGPVQVASAGLSDDPSQVAQTPMPGPTGVVRPWSAWLRGYGVTASGDSTINATSFDETRYGAIGGLDYHINDSLLIGGVFNYAHGEVNLDQPTPATNKQDAYQFAGYAKYQPGTPWYVNAIVGGGFTTNNESRQVTIPAPATVSASYNGETFTAYGEAGWDLYPMGSNFKLTPLVGVGYNWLRYDGFQESGSVSALHVQSATTSNLYSAIGARAQTAINIGTAAPLVPEVRVVWEHEFLDANQEMNAAFGGSSLFNVQGSKFGRESIIAGVGISNNVAPDLKVFLDYDGKFQDGYTAHAVSAGLRWSFGGAAPMPPPAAPPPVPAAQPAPPPPAQTQTFVVYFDFDKSDLTPEAHGIIKQAADAFRANHAVNIKVDGYTDLAGTAKYNVGLSKRRADAVRAELVKDGVANNAVAEAWHGKDNPAVPTPDGVREPRNRRATIMLP